MLNKGDKPASFVDDAEDGGYILYCVICEEEFIDKSSSYEECKCPKCNTSYYYCSHWEW